jgi:DNA adenine methylase
MAELFYYLNRTGYNGLCRFNRRGEFNVPFGKYKKINYRKSFEEYSLLMETWELLNLDFRDLLSLPEVANKGSFVFADPPYDSDGKGFVGYGGKAFDWADQFHLASLLYDHPGPVVACNLATSRILTLYQSLNFDIELVNVPRRISCKGANRAPVQEMIATRNLTNEG